MKFSLTILIALLFLSSVSHETEGKSENDTTFVDEEEELELEMQLKILNKPPIKSFKRNGGIIDCIDIYKQPAFDHPHLKNHKLQMRPSSLPEGMESGRKDATIRQTDQNEFIGCPSGTVPLKRVAKEDLIKAKAVLDLVHPNNDFVHPDDYIPGGQLDYAALTTARKEFYGAKARVSIFNLTGISAPQISETMLWIGSNTDADYNSIEFGWTVDGHKETGCYNALCPGYVQVSQKFIMGDVLSVVTIPGKQVAGIWFTLFQDPKTSNWWLVVTRADGENEGIGYWPKELLPGMAESAWVIQLGGKAYSAGAGIYLPLGSGVYLENDFSRTCLIDHIEFVNKNHQYYKPTGETMIWDTSDLEHYKIKYLGELQPRGCSLVFGGPDIRT